MPFKFHVKVTKSPTGLKVRNHKVSRVSCGKRGGHAGFVRVQQDRSLARLVAGLKGRLRAI